MANPLSIDPNAVMSRALDGLAARERVIANNVANVDTPGFKASRVTFEGALQQAIARGEGGPELALARTDPRHLLGAGVSRVADVQPVVHQSTQTSLRNDGNNVDIEVEMASLAETSLRFDAVSEALARRLAMQRLIASDGRG